MSKGKYVLDMGYSELTNTIYALIKDSKGNIVEKKDVTDQVLNMAHRLYIERITDSIDENVDKTN